MNQDQYKIGKLFEDSTCISKDTLLQYVDGQLSGKALRAVEMHLIDCPFCDDALEGIQSVGTVEFQKILGNVTQRIENHVQQTVEADEPDNVIEFRPTIHPPVAARKTSRLLPFLSIAASIILIAVLAIMFIGGDTASSIADRHFKEATASTARGANDAPETLLEQADAKFNAKDYTAALALYNQVDAPQGLYGAGNSYYALGDFGKAASKFEAVISGGKDWVTYAEFNLALSYLKLDRVADAKALLEKIAGDDDHDFSKQAKAALEDVNDL